MSAKSRFRNARGATGGKNDRAAERRSLTVFQNGDSPLPSARYRTNYGLAKVSPFLKGIKDSYCWFVPSYSQRGRMLAFAGAVRMTRTTLRRHTVDRAELLPAVLAGVLRFFVALVKFVSSLSGTVRMARTTLRRKTGYRRKTLSAMLAIKVRHFPFPFLLPLIVADSTAERRVAPYKAKVVPSRFVSFPRP